MGDKTHWMAGRTVLLVTVKKNKRQVQSLTWLSFGFVIEGLRSFTDAYPGVNTFFEIFEKVGPSGRERRVFLGVMLFGTI